MKPSEIIPEFDAFLAGKGLRLEAVVIGGAALNLLKVIDRGTKDCDVLVPELAAEILEAANEFRGVVAKRNVTLIEGWLNNGPASLAKQLPGGWELRLQEVFVGQAMHLQTLGRPDLLRSKLFALCDRGIDIEDCLALRPTAAELTELLPWVQYQDANPQWPEHVRRTLDKLARRLGHGV